MDGWVPGLILSKYNAVPARAIYDFKAQTAKWVQQKPVAARVREEQHFRSMHTDLNMNTYRLFHSLHHSASFKPPDSTVLTCVLNKCKIIILTIWLIPNVLRGVQIHTCWWTQKRRERTKLNEVHTAFTGKGSLEDTGQREWWEPLHCLTLPPCGRLDLGL